MEGSTSNPSYAHPSEEAMNSKYSIKNILFYRAIPNYEIPYTTNGYVTYTCKDCGDGFVMESSYQSHIQRKSVLIKYNCRNCPRRALIFYNRCNLLSHIRSHTVRTATINVSDLSVEPLPLSFFKIKPHSLAFLSIPTTLLEKTPQLITTPQLDNAPQSETAPQYDNVTQSLNALQYDDTTQSNNTTQSDNTTKFYNSTQSSNLTQSDNMPHSDSAPQILNKNQGIVMSGVNSSICCDCKKDITSTGILYKDRASHYMRYTNQVYSCPICLFNLPTVCGLRAHLRIHLKIPPFYCPECGMQMSNKSVIYPYTHGCEGFNMMRATARSQCPTKKCNLFHPNHFNKHMIENHLKLIYKCSMCVVACFNESTMIKHAKTHDHDICPQRFYQCDLCPGRLVMLNHTDRHTRSHSPIPVYPCWTCNKPFKNAIAFIDHHIEKHCQYDDVLKNMLFASLTTVDILPDQSMKKLYRVVKRCDQCLRNFTYKCQYEDINNLLNSCPYKCVPGSQANIATIECPLCNSKIEQTWEVIKEHFTANHKEHRCLDIKISLPRLNLKKYKNKVLDGSIKKRITRRSKLKSQKNPKMNVEIIIPNEIRGNSNCLECSKCKHECETKELLEKHVLTHRDPCMAYQCMECGECFVVKTSFSTHLLLEHAITDVDKYTNDKKCYNENALIKSVENVVEETLNENQCKICRDQFNCLDDLEKHFRVHGMAFLIKNSLNKPNS